MKLEEEGIRGLISAALALYMVVIAGYLWFVDLLAKQEEFGLFLATELGAVAMLTYIGTKPSYNNIKKSWLLLGCVYIALLLTIILLK